MSRVFISYRREDTASVCGRLYKYLTDRLRGHSVYMDVDTISPGEDFRVSIENAIATSDVILAIIGPEWISCTNKDGIQRLSDPSDFVRIELELALQLGIPLVPVLVQGAEVPKPGELDPEWEAVVQVLKRMPRSQLITETGLSRSALTALRNGRARPHRATRAALQRAAGRFARTHLGAVASPRSRVPRDDVLPCAQYLQELGDCSS